MRLKVCGMMLRVPVITTRQSMQHGRTNNEHIGLIITRSQNMYMCKNLIVSTVFNTLEAKLHDLKCLLDF